MPNILPLPDSFVGHCLVYVTIPQKCIKIDQELFFFRLKVNKSGSIKGLQNSVEDY